MVAAGADDGVVAVGQRGTGDGPLHVSISGGEPTATKARQEIGEVEAIALGSGGGTWLKTKNVTIIGPFHFQYCLPSVDFLISDFERPS